MRKARDYSYENIPEPIPESDYISDTELANLSLEEMMRRANGVPKQTEENE